MLFETDADAIKYALECISREPAIRSRFTAASVTQFICDELFSILQPTLAIKTALLRQVSHVGAIQFDSDLFLESCARMRVEFLLDFLRSACHALKEGAAGNPMFIGDRLTSIRTSLGAGQLAFRTLTADSHNRGTRPLVFSTPKGDVVLKFADPRPYQLLASILGIMSRDLAVDLAPPTIFPDSANRWYLIPYIETNDACNAEDVTTFIFSLGVLTAVGYCLRMTDIHVENLIVSDGKPVIIDPECLLYHFSKDDESKRLLNTGLVAKSVHLSALRGGGTQEKPIMDLVLHFSSDGRLKYRKPSENIGNRAYAAGEAIDPAEYVAPLLEGYRAAYQWFVVNSDTVADVINDFVCDDFRIRYLVRATSHYASVVHMLNLPVVDEYSDHRDKIIQKFRESGHFPVDLSHSIIS